MNKIKRIISEYEYITDNYLENCKYKTAKNDALIFSDKYQDEIEISLENDNLKVQKVKDNKTLEVIITFSKRENILINCEETIIEEREKGFIIEKITKIYGASRFSNEPKYLTDILSRRYVVEKDITLDCLSSEETLSEIALLKTTFSSHMKDFLTNGNRYYTDTPASNNTYLNDYNISKIYAIVEGPTKIEKIYDLYNGKITQDNSYDLLSIGLGLLNESAYAYKEVAGITAKENYLIGEGTNDISKAYLEFVRDFIKKEIKYPYDFDLTNRQEFIKILNYKPTAVDICKEKLERMIGLPYHEFEKLDFDEQQRLIELTRSKNSFMSNESHRVMIGNWEHAIFIRVESTNEKTKKTKADKLREAKDETRGAKIKRFVRKIMGKKLWF